MKTYPGLWRAKVEDNDDSGEEHPYYGAIKVRVIEIHGPDLPKKQLPWAQPVNMFGQGRDEDGYDYCSLNIPKINTWVWVMFEHGDPNRPIYMGSWIGGQDSELPEAFKEDDRGGGNEYPEIRGWIFGFDGGNFALRIFDKQRMEIYFDEDNIIEIDSEGISPNEEATITVRTDWLIKLKSEKKIKLEAPEIEIDADSKLEVKCDGQTKVQGSTVTVQGGSIIGSGAVAGSFEHPRR